MIPALRTGGRAWAAGVLAVASLVSACTERMLTVPGRLPDGGTPILDGAPPLADANAGDADGSADGGGPAACTPGGGPISEVTGTIDHRSYLLDPSSAIGIQFPILQSSWSILKSASVDEALLAWGEGDRDGGVQHDAGALIVVPAEPPSRTTYYCAATVEAQLVSDIPNAAVAITLSDLSRLGSCPATPVPADVQACTGRVPPGDAGAGPCTSGLGISGTVEGVAIDFRSPGGTITVGDEATDPIEIRGDNGDRGVFFFESRSDGSIAGWLRLPNGDGENAGTVYCLEGGRATKQADRVYSVAFGSVGRVGRCPGVPVDGQLHLCR